MVIATLAVAKEEGLRVPSVEKYLVPHCLRKREAPAKPVPAFRFRRPYRLLQRRVKRYRVACTVERAGLAARAGETSALWMSHRSD